MKETEEDDEEGRKRMMKKDGRRTERIYVSCDWQTSWRVPLSLFEGSAKETAFRVGEGAPPVGPCGTLVCDTGGSGWDPTAISVVPVLAFIMIVNVYIMSSKWELASFYLLESKN